MNVELNSDSNGLRVTGYGLHPDEANRSVPSHPSPVTRNSSPGGAVYWLLIVMGLGTFAPCVLLPEWREYQAVRAVERAEQQRLNDMARFVDREKHLLEGMQSDPAVIARVARRDLRFYRPGETSVAVDVPVLLAAQSAPSTDTTDELPPSLRRAGTYLPNFNYDALFCEPQTRRILMVLSIGLIVTAIGLFWHKPSSVR